MPEEATGEETNGSADNADIPENEIDPDEPLKDPLDILKEQLDEKTEELAELRNETLRVKADTENYKKRLQKEKADSIQFANEKLLKELLTVKDNLERALSVENPQVDTLKEGVAMTLKQFDALLEKQNVESIEAVGKPFDPSRHEVLCQVESEDHDENTVTEEYAKGYHLNGRILRPSKVVISKAPAGGNDTKDANDSPEAGENGAAPPEPAPE